MADIRIAQAHALTPAQARQAAQDLADQLAREYQVETEWDGDTMRFEHSAVTGTLALAPAEARLELTLGGLYKAFAPVLEQKLAAKMGKMFG